MMRCLALAPIVLLAALIAPPPGRATSVTPPTGAGGLSGKYDVSRAIVIGINDYHSANVNKLQFAAQDANEVADELIKDYGFEAQNVVRLINGEATLENIRKKIYGLAKSGKNDRVVIFFAGHGTSKNGRGFFLPVDAEIDPNDDSSYATCMDVRDIQNMLDLCKAKHVLILADACFSGFLIPRAQGIQSQAASVLMGLTVREIITAGTQEEVSTEDANLKHGIFTAKLLEQLQARAHAGASTFSASNLFDKVYEGVVNTTHARQKPQHHKMDGAGEFLFRTPDVAVNPDSKAGDALSSVVTMKFEVLDRGGLPIQNAVICINEEPLWAQRQMKSIDLEDNKTMEVSVAVYAAGFQPKSLHVVLERGKPSPVLVTLEACLILPKPKTKMSVKGNVEMIYIPEGTFAMGDPFRWRTVHLDDYWIGKNDVTVAQYRFFCETSGYKYDWDKNKPAWGWEKHDDHPMVNVTWQEARDYAKWAGCDLPTEAQWEKAARGDDGRNYPWGNDWDATKRWGSKDERGDAKSTAPVGTLPSGASPYGCLDMAGNVWQWCLDWDGRADLSATSNPTGPKTGDTKVVRGGGWYLGDPDYFQCAYRIRFDPTKRANSFGFRIAGKA